MHNECNTIHCYTHTKKQQDKMAENGWKKPELFKHYNFDNNVNSV